MTLFKKADEENKCKGIFQEIKYNFFDGKDDKLTLNILEKQELNNDIDKNNKITDIKVKKGEKLENKKEKN